jgi:2-methylcitrate dehydratase
LSQVWVDGQPLRVYRHAPNTGPRKSWAAGDATRRAVQLALMVRSGEPGYPGALTAKTWGFYDVSLRGKPFAFPRPFSSYVMENILFKISWPAEFHAQTAVECAVLLHPKVRHRLNEIERIDISTHESAIRIISKNGPLHNPADRDHCLQYMVAVALLTGNLNAASYENDFAENPQIDALREKMHVTEEESFSTDYLDPDKRSIASAIQVFFRDGTASERILIEYPLGHKRRRKEGRPFLHQKFDGALQQAFSAEQAQHIKMMFEDQKLLLSLPVRTFLERLQPCGEISASRPKKPENPREHSPSREKSASLPTSR